MTKGGGYVRRPVTRQASKGPPTRSSSKGKPIHIEIDSSDSHDSYDSVEDSLYKPGGEKSSSDDEDSLKISAAKTKKFKSKHASQGHLSKEKRKILLEYDGLVVGESDSGEDDNYFFGGSGMPCVHACAALARAGKRPDEFCHKWLTMDAYNDTYAFHLNPITGQAMWEKSPYNRPQAPKFKKMPGAPKKKRRKDANEDPDGSNKQKTKMKRSYKKAAAAAAKSGNSNPAVHTITTPVVNPTHAIPPAAVPSQVGAHQKIQNEGQAEVELGMSQPIMSQNEDSLQMETSLVQHNARPPKLTTKRMVSQPSSTPPATNVPVDPMQGASSGTATRLASFMKFVPTPGFKPPRKKN
ncbi:hypothetical protein Ahy_A10g046981 [Arachis hypogaea]|uniref:Uncharacterized protein n=1 Tax=Arachis hypogaea TaxID=3818 RepID=A0A445B147_ARAHY|nr:hypothetical protein Ahy_A10g046981 [Arachis hypogaea]